ncbi:unnamed protein product [Meloidogyne enterolobii]|uniref:Uncharacterized protein n=1 Tax=Meloidogyne enterolobii TaxID=390850 RepID=A0ACB0Y067_MELEN
MFFLFLFSFQPKHCYCVYQLLSYYFFVFILKFLLYFFSFSNFFFSVFSSFLSFLPVFQTALNFSTKTKCLATNCPTIQNCGVLYRDRVSARDNF